MPLQPTNTTAATALDLEGTDGTPYPATAFERTANKNQPNGYVGTDVNGDVLGTIVMKEGNRTQLNGFVPEAGQPVYVSDDVSGPSHYVAIGDGTTNVFNIEPAGGWYFDASGTSWSVDDHVWVLQLYQGTGQAGGAQGFVMGDPQSINSGSYFAYDDNTGNFYFHNGNGGAILCTGVAFIDVGGGYVENASQIGYKEVVASNTSNTWTPNAIGGLINHLSPVANFTIANPIGSLPGAELMLIIHQDGTGSRTVAAWGTLYKFTTTNPQPTLSTAANAVDMVTFRYSATLAKWLCVAFNKGVA